MTAAIVLPRAGSERASAECASCGALFLQGAKPRRNCPDCRRAWRENSRRRSSGPTARLRFALEEIAKRAREPEIRKIALEALNEHEEP